MTLGWSATWGLQREAMPEARTPLMAHTTASSHWRAKLWETGGSWLMIFPWHHYLATLILHIMHLLRLEDWILQLLSNPEFRNCMINVLLEGRTGWLLFFPKNASFSWLSFRHLNLKRSHASTCTDPGVQRYKGSSSFWTHTNMYHVLSTHMIFNICMYIYINVYIYIYIHTYICINHWFTDNVFFSEIAYTSLNPPTNRSKPCFMPGGQPRKPVFPQRRPASLAALAKWYGNAP